MQTKLTLRIDDRLVVRAKRHARTRGKSVSRMVSDFFSLLGEDGEGEEPLLPPVVRALKGSLRGKDVDESDHLRHLLEKHR